MTPCQLALSSVSAGRYAITVMAGTEASGCGARGARIALWTFARGRIIYSRETRRWPGRGGGRARLDASFATAAPDGSGAPQSEFAGEVYTPDGRHLPANSLWGAST